jgi:hypothetical protein
MTSIVVNSAAKKLTEMCTCHDGVAPMRNPACSVHGDRTLPIPPRDVIEQQARDAAAAGQTLNDACPYPFTSPAGMHFAAVYALSLNHPPMRTEPRA